MGASGERARPGGCLHCAFKPFGGGLLVHTRGELVTLNRLSNHPVFLLIRGPLSTSLWPGSKPSVRQNPRRSRCLGGADVSQGNRSL